MKCWFLLNWNTTNKVSHATEFPSKQQRWQPSRKMHELQPGSSRWRQTNMLTAVWCQIWHNSHHHYSQLHNGTCHAQRQETSRKAHQCNKTAHVKNSSERSTRQCAQGLHIPHRTVRTVLHPDDYNNCYEHAELWPWQCSLLQQALQSSWHSHVTNQCVCLECRGKKIPHYMTATSAHYTPAGSPAANVKPQATCPPDVPKIHATPSCFKGCVPNGKY